MNTIEQLKALKKSGEPCKVSYGKTLMAEGKVVDLAPSTTPVRVWILTALGEVGIPIEIVRRVDA